MTTRHASSTLVPHVRAFLARRLVRAGGTSLLAAGLIMGSAAAARPASSAATLKSLAGTWRVVAVEVAESPVQALVQDDPSYIGALLDVSPTRLS